LIVLVSDLHLTDGASGTTVEPGAFALFARLIGEMARHASHRRGRFQPLREGLDLILLGDTLDLLRSTAWPVRGPGRESVPRPWDPPERVAHLVGLAVDRILARNDEALAVLRRLGQEGAWFHEGGRTFHIPVRITYFVGNHDWPLRLPGPVYEAIRWRVTSALGLANPPGPFPHTASEADPQLAARLRAHRLVVRHGDVHDPDSYDGERNRSAIADGVVIELLNRLAPAVREALGLEERDPLLRALNEMDNVRPFAMIPFWVLGTIRRLELEGKHAGKVVADVWSHLCEQFFALDFVRQWDRRWQWDPVDRLQLKFGLLERFIDRPTVRFVAARLLPLLGDGYSRFVHHALAEPEIASGEADYVAYGHTHFHEVRPLAVGPGRRGRRQFYFNTGTWLPFYRRTVAHPERLEFLAYHTFSVLTFYQGDERAGRGFEVWNGALSGP
jgi:hypothetical protein